MPDYFRRVATGLVSILLAALPLVACGGGGAASAEQAAQWSIKAFISGDTEKMWQRCNPSVRENASDQQKERFIAGGWLTANAVEKEKLFAWIAEQKADPSEAVNLIQKDDLAVKPVSVREYNDWAEVFVDRRVFVEGEERHSLRLPVHLEFELVKEDGAWWDKCS